MSDTDHKMTAEQARTFERFSPVNAAVLLATAQENGCNCAPYSDWFTYNRWLAQGLQVQRGQRGVKLPTIVHKQIEKDGKTEKISIKKTYAVFCRCQVAPARPILTEEVQL